MAEWRKEFAWRLERKREATSKALVDVYRQAAREILGALTLGEDAPVEAARQGRILEQITPIMQRLNTKASLELGTLLTDAYRRTKQEVFRLAMLRTFEPRRFGVGIAFDRIPEERVRATVENSLELINSIGADLQARIRQQMGIALVRGESIRELARRIAGQGLTVDGSHPSFHTAEVRANVIARTETARVQAVTVQESIRQVADVSHGILMEWSAVLETACKECVALDGLRVPVGETFNGFTVPRHPRCRCVIIPYVPPIDQAPQQPRQPAAMESVQRAADDAGDRQPAAPAQAGGSGGGSQPPLRRTGGGGSGGGGNEPPGRPPSPWLNHPAVTRVDRAAFDQVARGAFEPHELINAITEGLPPGFEVDPNSITITPRLGRIYYEASYRKGIYQAGDISRRIERNYKGELHVHHSSFFIPRAFQGEGLAQAVYEASDRFYRRAGVRDVSIFANGTVGKYVWAQQGFDFEDATEVTERRAKLKDALHRLGVPGYDDAVESLEHSWDFAGFRVNRPSGREQTFSPDQWEKATGLRLPGEVKGRLGVGKAFMLSMYDWDGVKDLTPGSPGLKVAEAYAKKAARKRKRRP